jgi:hypothetical protein
VAFAREALKLAVVPVQVELRRERLPADIHRGLRGSGVTLQAFMSPLAYVRRPGIYQLKLKRYLRGLGVRDGCRSCDRGIFRGALRRTAGREKCGRGCEVYLELHGSLLMRNRYFWVGATGPSAPRSR